ncbi:hypothetical protein [Bradyrhizobium cajani]|nr:hypothetical protein [Bradyrhizobium cajani]
MIWALSIGEMRKRMSGEATVHACTISMNGTIAAIALNASRS